jgi:FkbM family methyltransferase
MWSFFQFINDECTLTIVDVGAAMTDVPSYQKLIDIKRARLIGFEPDADACRRLNDSYGKPHLFLPHFVGDGRPAVFHETNWGPTGSLFEPNTPLLEKFHHLSEVVIPVARHAITTVRLDDIAEVDDVDFIKIDVQGSELAVFQNASRVLADAVLIQTEVCFLELYKNQPMFSDIDAFLRANGFQFHDFVGVGTRSFKSVMSPQHSFLGFRQGVWADAYYVRDWMNWDTLPPTKLKRLAALLHDIVGSYDLAHLALEAMDRQIGSHEAPRYLRRLQEGGRCSVSGADDRVNRSADIDRQTAMEGDQKLVFPPNADDCLPEGKLRRVLNVGGNSKEIQLPFLYDGWQHVLLDIDPDCTPDVLCDARNLSALSGAEYDSVYCSHNLEHYYHHDVRKVLSGFFHILKDPDGHFKLPHLWPPKLPQAGRLKL